MTGMPFVSGPFGSGSFSAEPFYTTKTLIDAILRTTTHQNPTNETAKRAAILAMLNNKYQEICMGKHWRWMFRSVDLDLQAPYQVGTASATQGSYDVVGLGTTWDATLHAGCNFQMQGDDFIYTVAEVTSATTLKLTSKFASADVSDAGYTIARSRYLLPHDCAEVLSMWIDGNWELVPQGVQEMRQIESRSGLITGTPRFYTIVDKTENDDRYTVEVFPAPEQRYSIHMDYKRRILKLWDSNDSCPLIPDTHRAVLYYAGLAEFFLYLKDPQSALLADQQYQRFLTRLMSDTALTDSKVKIQPGRNYRNARRMSLRSSLDRYEFGRDD